MVQACLRKNVVILVTEPKLVKIVDYLLQDEQNEGNFGQQQIVLQVYLLVEEEKIGVQMHFKNQFKSQI